MNLNTDSIFYEQVDLEIGSIVVTGKVQRFKANGAKPLYKYDGVFLFREEIAKRLYEEGLISKAEYIAEVV